MFKGRVNTQSDLHNMKQHSFPTSFGKLFLQMAYLATSLLVEPASELSILVTATIQADLKSDNFLVGKL